jgi:hypothetical protein
LADNIHMHVCVRTHILMEMVYFAAQARRCPPSAMPSVTVILLCNVEKNRRRNAATVGKTGRFRARVRTGERTDRHSRWHGITALRITFASWWHVVKMVILRASDSKCTVGERFIAFHSTCYSAVQTWLCALIRLVRVWFYMNLCANSQEKFVYFLWIVGK